MNTNFWLFTTSLLFWSPKGTLCIVGAGYTSMVPVSYVTSGHYILLFSVYFIHFQ